MKDNSEMVVEMGKEFGLQIIDKKTVIITKVSIKTTKKVVSVYIVGKMELNMKDSF